MLDLSRPASDIAFSPSVKAFQSARGSREAAQDMDDAGAWPRRITPDLAAFIAVQSSAVLATASRDAQPYVQHRGGPPGFLVVLDETTIGFADVAGNRQYITLGNLAENPKAHLLLIDYARRARVKLWGEARVVTDDPSLLARLMPRGYRARPEQAILFTVSTWNRNCPQHIPQRFEAADVQAALDERDARIATLEREVARLTSAT